MKKTIYFIVLIFIFSACSGNISDGNDEKTEEVQVETTIPSETNENSKLEELATEELQKKIEIKILTDSEKKNFKTKLAEFGNIDYYFFYESMYYFYLSKNGKKGIIDQNKSIIIPIKFDKIYNLNSLIKNMFVVETNNKKGIYNIKGKEILQTIYDDLYPVKDTNILVQVRKENLFAWINLEGQAHFNSTKNVEYCKSPFESKLILDWKMTHKSIGLLTIDNNDDTYYFTPSYIYSLGIVEDSYRLAIAEDSEMGVYSVDAEVTEVKTFGGKLKALLTTFIEEGAGPRDDYVEKVNKLTVLNSDMTKSSEIHLGREGEYAEFGYNNSSYQFIGNEIIEVIGLETQNYPYHSLPSFDYYQIKEDGMIDKLESSRFFNFTKFIEIDESYFKIASNEEPSFNDETGAFVVLYDHLTILDLDLMRNEIFAEYGYRFKTEKWQKIFGKSSWYKAKHDNVDDQLTEIDKHNIRIILKMKKKMKEDEKKYTNKRTLSYVAAG